MQELKKPIRRSKIRSKLGLFYYGAMRKVLWVRMRKKFATVFWKDPLPFPYFTHETVLRRRLKDVDMWMQENKIINLKLAVEKLNGIIIGPGEIFSYWHLIGKPSKQKGYVKGMVLKNGNVYGETGGGLCQLSNLIFWMSIHTPLTVLERHRHSYDVFPDSNRTQPFGSGATCFYPHRDLMIRNNTEDTYQLLLHVGEEYLEGTFRVSASPQYRFEVIEKNHEMRMEYWGGYSRRNELYQQRFDLQNHLLEEQGIVKNAAIMMYAPFLENKEEG